MADIVERLILDDSGFTGPLQNAAKALEDATKNVEEYQNKTTEASKEIGKEATKSGEAQTKAAKEVAKENRNASNSFLDYVKNIKVFGVSMNDLIGKYRSAKEAQSGLLSILKNGTQLTMTQARGVVTLSNALGGGRTAIAGMAKGFNILKVAIASTGIGLLIIALGSLIAFFTRTQQGIDRLSANFAYVKGAINVVIDAFASLGSRIYKLFSEEGLIGTVKKFANIMVEAFLNPIETFRKLRDGVYELAGAMDDAGSNMKALSSLVSLLKVEMINLTAEEAKYRAEIAKSKKDAEDVTKSYGTRVAAAKKAYDLENQLLQKKLSIQERLAEAIYAENQQSNSLNADLQKQAEAFAEVDKIKAESLEKQIELQNKINGILKEAQDSLRGITKEVVETAKAYNLITDQEAFEFAKQEQIKNLELLKKQLQSIFTLVKDPSIPKQIEIIEQSIRGLSNSVYDPPAPAELAPRIAKNIQLAYDIAIPQINPGQVKFQEPDFTDLLAGVNDFQDLWELTTDEIFGPVTGEKVREFTANLHEAFAAFSAIANESGQLQIDQIDKQLDALNQRREELQDGLDKELELQEKGLANNVGAKQDEVDALLAEEERLNKEKEKIQAAAQRRQIILDSIAQGQSLITSSINIIKGFSNIPVVGLPLGIAAVATLLGFFAKTKVDALRATRLYTGAERVSDHFGFSDRYGETDLPGYQGQGYAVVRRRDGKDTGVTISGREMLLPEQLSLKNEEFFSNLKSGLYNGIDLVESINLAMSYKKSANRTTQDKTVYLNATQQRKEKTGQWVTYIDKKGRSKAYYVDKKAEHGDQIIFEM